MLGLLLAACDSGSGGGSKSPVSAKNTTISISSVGLEGEISEPATVVVNGVSDQDGVADANFQFEISLGSHGLPSEPSPGGSAVGTLDIQVTDSSGNVGAREVILTIYK